MEIAYPEIALIYGYTYSMKRYRLFTRYVLINKLMKIEKNVDLSSLIRYRSYNEAVSLKYLDDDEVEFASWTYKFNGEMNKDVIERLKLKTLLTEEEFNDFIEYYKPQY